MKNILKNIILAGAFILFIVSPVMTVATSLPVNAAPCNEGSILGVPPWYRGLVKTEGDNCTIVSPNEVDGLTNFIWRIILNGIEMVLVIISYIAFFFILYGGFLFITGGGNSSQVEKARKSIFNAIIGLIISLGAIAITNLIFNVLIGSGPVNQYGVHEINPNTLLLNSLNLVYYISGIVAIIVIIIAGLMYTTSMGDSGRITRAKSMILYSVIGLGVVISAWAITNFVIGNF